MKRVILVLAIMLALCAVSAIAENMDTIVVENVSTNTVTGDDYVWGANTLVFSSTTRRVLVKKINITNADTTVAQKITFWDGFSLNTSSANVTKVWEVDIDAAGTAEADIEEIDFGDRWYLKFDYGMAITKTSTSSNIVVSLQYR